MRRKGLGKGLGRGYKNLVPMDSHIHALSAKGVKTKQSWEMYAKMYKKKPLDDAFDSFLMTTKGQETSPEDHAAISEFLIMLEDMPQRELNNLSDSDLYDRFLEMNPDLSPEQTSAVSDFMNFLNGTDDFLDYLGSPESLSKEERNVARNLFAKGKSFGDVPVKYSKEGEKELKELQEQKEEIDKEGRRYRSMSSSRRRSHAQKYRHNYDKLRANEKSGLSFAQRKQAVKQVTTYGDKRKKYQVFDVGKEFNVTNEVGYHESVKLTTIKDNGKTIPVLVRRTSMGHIMSDSPKIDVDYEVKQISPRKAKMLRKSIEV